MWQELSGKGCGVHLFPGRMLIRAAIQIPGRRQPLVHVRSTSTCPSSHSNSPNGPEIRIQSTNFLISLKLAERRSKTYNKYQENGAIPITISG
jgi:hypothetical protein